MLHLNLCFCLFQHAGIALGLESPLHTNVAQSGSLGSCHNQIEADRKISGKTRSAFCRAAPDQSLSLGQSFTAAQETEMYCDNNIKDPADLDKELSMSLSDLEAVQHRAQPTHAIFSFLMLKRIENAVGLKALDSNALAPCFKTMLPTNNSESCPGNPASLYSELALAVNFSNVSSYLKGNVSVQHALPSLVHATQVQQIVVMSQVLRGKCKQKEEELSVSSTLQELATRLPATIYIYNCVNSIATDAESSNNPEIMPLVFEPKQPPHEVGSNPPKVSLILGSDTATLNFAFSAYTGRFWVLVQDSSIAQYNRACKTNEILKAKLDELCVQGTFKKKKSEAVKLHADGGNKKIHDLSSSLHKIVFEKHRKGGLLLPVFTQHGILTMLANQRDQMVAQSPAGLVLQIGSLSNQALPDSHALDSALGMVIGQHFFDPVSTKFFLCESAALLSNWCPTPDERTGFPLDCNKFCAHCTKLLCYMEQNCGMALSAMRAAVAAATILAMVMPVDQALDCWKSLNRGIASVQRMSTCVKSAGCALISLFAFTRQQSESLQSGLESANQVLHSFFENLQSEDQGVQLLKTLFLSKTLSAHNHPFSCPEEAERIGEVLLTLRLVCQNQSILQCLQKIKHGEPSASIVGLVAGALIGVSGLEKGDHPLPAIHIHQKAQLQAITSVLANCYKVLNFICLLNVQLVYNEKKFALICLIIMI